MIQIKDTAAGYQLGNHPTQKIGLWGATPVQQPASAGQTAVTDSTGGSTSDKILAAVGPTNSADASAAINANLAKLAVLLNAIRSALVDAGLMKGGA